MKALLFILLLCSSCDFVGWRVLPFVEYSEGGRGSLGFDGQTNTFRQRSDEPTWTAGVGLSIPLGQPQEKPIKITDWMPRYPVPVIIRDSGGRPFPETPAAKEVEKSTFEEGKEIIEGKNWIPYMATIAGLLIIVVVLNQLGLIKKVKKKNG